MTKDIMKLLGFGIICLACVISPIGNIVSSQAKHEITVETEVNDLHTWEDLEFSAGAHKEIMVSVVPNKEPIVTSPIIEYSNGWTKTNVNVRTEPSLESTVLEVFHYNHQVEYADFDEEWVQIKYKDDVAYIYKEHISSTINTCREYAVPANKGFKSFEPYNYFNPKYNQYKLQQHAYTGEYGLRKVNDRYCIALGTYFFEHVTNDIIGTYIDLVLENGEVIHCILGDIKADEHTDASNIQTVANGCLSEFIVDKSQLSSNVRQMGDVSYATSEWRSPVAKVIVYDKNFFNE